MSTLVTYNGNQFSVPSYSDVGYAQGTGNLSSYLIALATGSLNQSGGAFSLLADVNFGASFGLISKYYKSITANIAQSGLLRLAKTDTIAWRNNANGADLALGIDGSNNLTFSSNALLIAGTAFTNLAPLTASIVPVTDGSGYITSSAVTATTLGYLDATSSVQTQLNAMLPKAGGTMTGTITMSNSGTIAMGAAKITGLANGTAAQDAVAFTQVSGTRILSTVQATTQTQSDISSATFADTNLTLAITPASTASKVKITISGSMTVNTAGQTGFITLTRNGSNIGGTSGFFIANGGTGNGVYTPFTLVFLDSPASASAVTYTIQTKVATGHVYIGNGATTQVILLEEIG